MSKIVTKFVYVPLNKRHEFHMMKEQNSNIIPCSVYVDKNEQKIFFIEEYQGEILDITRDICINDSPGLLIGNEAIGF